MSVLVGIRSQVNKFEQVLRSDVQRGEVGYPRE